MDHAVDNCDKSGAGAVIPDGFLHSLCKIVDSGIDHAAESSSAFHDNEGLAGIDGMLYLIREDDIVLGRVVDFDILKHILICCGSFLMDCGEHLDKEHPCIDIVMEIRCGDQIAVI